MFRAIAMMLISLKVLTGPAVCACSFAEIFRLDHNRCSVGSIVASPQKSCGCCGHRVSQSRETRGEEVTPPIAPLDDCPCKTDSTSFFVASSSGMSSPSSLLLHFLEASNVCFDVSSLDLRACEPSSHRAFVEVSDSKPHLPLFRVFSVILC